MKTRQSDRITQRDHIQSFNRGHPGSVDFDFVSLIHCQARECGPTTKKLKFRGQEVSNNEYVWDKNVVVKFRWLCDNCSLLISKSSKVVQN